MRVLLRRPRRGVVHEVGGGLVAAVGFGATGRVSISPDASIEQKTDYLLRRDQETQQRLDDLATTQRRHADAFEQGLEASQKAMEEHVATEIRRALDVHRQLRLVGIGCLVLGTLLLNAANFA